MSLQLEPEFEELYQEYHRQVADLEYKPYSPGKSPPIMARILLGDEQYEKRVRMPKWSVDVSMLMEPKVALRYGVSWGLISTSKHGNELKADHFEDLALKLKDEWDDVVNLAAKQYGNHGSLISGVYRDHFPDDVKDRLRFLAHGAALASQAAHLHRYLSKTRSPQFK